MAIETFEALKEMNEAIKYLAQVMKLIELSGSLDKVYLAVPGLEKWCAENDLFIEEGRLILSDKKDG